MCKYLLNVVIRKRASIFELLAGEDQTLLVGRYALFVLDLGFYVVDRVAGFDFEGDGFAGEGFYETRGAYDCEYEGSGGGDEGFYICTAVEECILVEWGFQYGRGGWYELTGCGLLRCMG